MELRLGRRSILAFAVAGALAVGGGFAYAITAPTIPDAGGVYRACMLNNVGTIRLIDKTLPASNLMSRCKTGLETEIFWNQQGTQGVPGPPGKDGKPDDAAITALDVRLDAEEAATVAHDARLDALATQVTALDTRLDAVEAAPPAVSVTSEVEPAGANCAHGGSKFTAAANSVTYACNGAPGATGQTTAQTSEQQAASEAVGDVTGAFLLVPGGNSYMITGKAVVYAEVGDISVTPRTEIRCELVFFPHPAASDVADLSIGEARTREPAAPEAPSSRTANLTLPFSAVLTSPDPLEPLELSFRCDGGEAGTTVKFIRSRLTAVGVSVSP